MISMEEEESSANSNNNNYVDSEIQKKTMLTKLTGDENNAISSINNSNKKRRRRRQHYYHYYYKNNNNRSSSSCNNNVSTLLNNICDSLLDCIKCEKNNYLRLLIQSLFNVFATICTCLTTLFTSIRKKEKSHLHHHLHHHHHHHHHHRLAAITTSTPLLLLLLLLIQLLCNVNANGLDKTEQLFDKLNLEQSIAAVFNKVAYGSTTKRSIPDNAYPLTTLATPLLTTFRYSDGNEEWLRVDVKDRGRSNIEFESPPNLDYDSAAAADNKKDENVYGSDLEKDHVLPTSAPAADILKNNNNKNYNNPNRYNNDRLRPDFNVDSDEAAEDVTDSFKTTTNSYNLMRNVRPTKSIYSKDIPSYVPPSRAFFTPPLPPQYQNPFADKPTLRGTNSDGFASRRPIPPPSLMPNKDRIPFRPDLPNKVNVEKQLQQQPDKQQSEIQQQQQRNNNPSLMENNNNNNNNKKKTLNTPSQNVKIGEFYGLNRNLNETSFEYEKNYAPEPSITRILSGSNGRHDDIQIPDILYRTVTATPNILQRASEPKKPRNPPVVVVDPPEDEDQDEDEENVSEENEEHRAAAAAAAAAVPPAPPIPPPQESVTGIKQRNETLLPVQKEVESVTTPMSDVVNLPNVKKREGNVTKATSDEIWYICWNVHVYLVVFGYILLAVYSIYKLIRYENDPHMFSKSYFLTIHLMLTVICVLRIFYLIYDPYNFNNSFNIFLYEFLHSFPLSLLATTFAVLILFLLKRTLTHLEVNRPVFLVFFALLHIVICLALSIMESFGHFDKASLTISRPSFVLLVLALGISYLYLYRIIKNVLAKRSQNLSEMCTQNISYASHITIAVALLFVLLGFVQLYALFFIKVDRFNGDIKHHWILWGFELSVRFIEISIITLLAIVVSLKMSQREKQTGSGGGGGGGGGFPLFPCTTSDSSTDNIYPNNCNSNPNAMNYTRNEMIMDNLPSETVERPNLLKNAFQNDSFDKKSAALELQQQQQQHYHSDSEQQRFERPNWVGGSDRFEQRNNNSGMLGDQQSSTLNLNSTHFERGSSQRNCYDSAKYYTKPKYDDTSSQKNIYSEPIDNHQQQQQHQYERTRHEFERGEVDRRSRNSSSNTSGRRSTAGRTRKNHARPHLGVQTLPPNSNDAIGMSGGRHHPQQQQQQQIVDSMLVDEQGFVRFRHMQEEMMMMKNAAAAAEHIKSNKHNSSSRNKKYLHQQQQQQNENIGHFSDA